MPGLLLVGSPFPAPDGFLPQLWAFGFFGLFFAVGYWLFGDDKLLTQCAPYWLWMLIASILLYALYYQLISKHIAIPSAPLDWQLKIPLKLCEAFISAWMTLVCLILGMRYLNNASRGMRFIADSSYWIYIIHIPVLFFIQYQLMDVKWNWVAKFGVSVSATLAIGVVTYAVLVRWTPIGWMLNGRKKSGNT